jgi:hypothetical protein
MGHKHRHKPTVTFRKNIELKKECKELRKGLAKIKTESILIIIIIRNG